MPEVATTLTFGGMTVRRLGFGAMRLTGKGVWGPPADEAEAVAVLRRFVERGGDFIDTADSYGPETSEALIAKALHPYPDGLVIAGKGGFVRPGPAAWASDARPAHLRRVCEASLRRLRLDCFPLYQLHTPDRRVPIEESVGALADLQREGKIRGVGVSNVTLDELDRARRAAAVVSVQNPYNLRDRGDDAILARCAADGLAFIAFYPLAKGKLAASGTALARVAARHGAAPGQVALAWLLHRSPALLPIPGTSSRAHLDENLTAATLRLSDDDMEELGA